MRIRSDVTPAIERGHEVALVLAGVTARAYDGRVAVRRPPPEASTSG
ncbi:hypothetical protein [Stackebrandtia soli]